MEVKMDNGRFVKNMPGLSGNIIGKKRKKLEFAKEIWLQDIARQFERGYSKINIANNWWSKNSNHSLSKKTVYIY